MGVIVKLVDFESGINQVAFNDSSESKLDSFITKFEKPYLCRILGIELAEFMLTNAAANNGTPTNADLLVIFNPLVTEFKRHIWSSQGIKEILKGFIAAEYIPKTQKEHTTGGMVITTGKNSKTPMTANFEGYNETMVNAMTVQIYCKQNSDQYPTFKGEKLETIDPLW